MKKNKIFNIILSWAPDQGFRYRGALEQRSLKSFEMDENILSQIQDFSWFLRFLVNFVASFFRSEFVSFLLPMFPFCSKLAKTHLSQISNCAPDDNFWGHFSLAESVTTSVTLLLTDITCVNIPLSWFPPWDNQCQPQFVSLSLLFFYPEKVFKCWRRGLSKSGKGVQFAL